MEISRENIQQRTVRSSDNGARKVSIGSQNLGNAKITNHDVSVLGQEHVLCFEIAMQNVSLVDVFDGQCDLRKDIENELLGAAGCGATGVDWVWFCMYVLLIGPKYPEFP